MNEKDAREGIVSEYKAGGGRSLNFFFGFFI